MTRYKPLPPKNPNHIKQATKPQNLAQEDKIQMKGSHGHPVLFQNTEFLQVLRAGII